MLRRVIITAYIFLFFLPLIPGNLFAYSVAPLVISLEVEARDIITRDITITNTSGAPISVYPSVNNISLGAGGTIEEFLSPSMSDRTRSLSSWVEIKRMGIDIKSGESFTIPLTVRVNPEPVPGIYHALIAFGSGGNSLEAEEKVRTGRAPGVILTVTVKDTTREFLKLGKFFVDRFVTDEENNAVSYVLQNPGDTPITPKGDIIFYDGRGREITAVAVNPENLLLEPGEEQAFVTAVPAEGLFGKYKAFLSVEYGSAQLAAVHDTSYFYVFPWRKMLIAFLAVLALVILASYLVHRRYLDSGDDADDAEVLPVRIRESTSASREHDINLKR